MTDKAQFYHNFCAFFYHFGEDPLKYIQRTFVVEDLESEGFDLYKAFYEKRKRNLSDIIRSMTEEMNIWVVKWNEDGKQIKIGMKFQDILHILSLNQNQP